VSSEAPAPSRRERQALATRRDIVVAARQLFAERGYAGAPIAEIAAAADVAVQTIYTAFGSKRGLLIALLDLIDEESGVDENAAAVFAADDPRDMLAYAVRLTRRLNERSGDIVWALYNAAASEPDARAALDEGLGRHRDGFEQFARKLHGSGGLRDGLSAARAAAIMTTMTANPVYRQLHEDFGWSWDEIERWIVDSLTDLVLRG
jgi:AcrR family transcriptional regulator